MTWSIVSDSSCDLRMSDFESERVRFETVPLRLQVGEDFFQLFLVIGHGAPPKAKFVAIFYSVATQSCKNGHVGRPGPRLKILSARPREWADARKK